ncbi:hypothetical protein DPMN_088401 [Dreissena polymorpha]|uniref:Uncharacterized protein n=1 Tax=Dreissena polymorpha TaxID=45954 RepID=A0A9D4QX92_DREPO|nr:hypothetical protein DPMN_088401 [Dreissena polymorpha]
MVRGVVDRYTSRDRLSVEGAVEGGVVVRDGTGRDGTGGSNGLSAEGAVVEIIFLYLSASPKGFQAVAGSRNGLSAGGRDGLSADGRNGRNGENFMSLGGGVAMSWKEAHVGYGERDRELNSDFFLYDDDKEDDLGGERIRATSSGPDSMLVQMQLLTKFGEDQLEFSGQTDQPTK